MPDSGEPQLTVSARGILLSWIERSGKTATLKFAERVPSGWTAPTAAASGADWFVNWADVPSVLRLADGTLAAHWLQKSGPGTYAYDVRLAYSKDEGRSWSPSFTPHTDGTRTEHGFASLFQVPGAGLGLIWLDGRATKPAAGHAPHGVHAGAMSLRATGFGRDWRQHADIAVDARVCDCCPTTTALTAEGPIAAFRNRSDQEVRDIYVTRFEHGKWTEPRAAHDDRWKIAACPVNGPMLSARGRDVALAWFTVKDDQGRALVAFSKDAGRSFGPPVRLDDTAALGRVDVEITAEDSALASWIEVSGQGAWFKVRRVEASGMKSAPHTISQLAGSRASGYPRIAAHDGELVVAWTEVSAGRSQVQTAVLRLN